MDALSLVIDPGRFSQPSAGLARDSTAAIAAPTFGNCIFMRQAPALTCASTRRFMGFWFPRWTGEGRVLYDIVGILLPCGGCLQPAVLDRCRRCPASSV